MTARPQPKSTLSYRVAAQSDVALASGTEPLNATTLTVTPDQEALAHPSGESRLRHTASVRKETTMSSQPVLEDLAPLAGSAIGEARPLSRRARWAGVVAGLAAMDAIMVNLAFLAAYAIRFNLDLPIFNREGVPDFYYYEGLVVSFVFPVWMVIFFALGLYRKQNLLGGAREYNLVFRAVTVGLIPVIGLNFLDDRFSVARGWLLVAGALGFLFVAVGRFTARRLMYALREQGYLLSTAVIVGANQEGRWLAEQLLIARASGLRLIGFIDEKVPAGTLLFHNLPSLGSVDQLDKVIRRYGVEEIILSTSAISSRDRMLDIFKRYSNSDDVGLRLSSGLYEIITTGLQVQEVAYVPLVNVNKVRLTGVDSILKLALDYVLTLPGMLLISPLLLLIAVAIKLDSPGPVVYRRRVMGLNGKQFDAFKFRTMHVNGDRILEQHPELRAELARNHKLKNDPRITRVGKWLRKFSLDELPQLLNVLLAEMSLVGPRMIAPQEMAQYNQWGLNLLTVRPGLTGLWQVSGRSDVSYEDRVRMDMYYIRNWTIWLDLQLLFQTLPAVIKGRGAY
jgi:exopolysaccharide biosynthesis polyprenyl glycosylphosphotransferase